MHLPIQQLKNALLRDGLVTEEVFTQLEQEATRLDQDIGDILVSRNIVPERYLVNLETQYFGVERVAIDSNTLDKNIVKLLPEEIARQRQVLVFSRNEDNSLNIAMANPSD